ncbi:MAG: right-handed parallel beta-helix repeat-containing protein [Candidatus Hodarchaeales archaeon]|jgi:parallel beta-helix repeat protein
MVTKNDVFIIFLILSVIFCSLVTYPDIIQDNNSSENTNFADFNVNLQEQPIFINSNDDFRSLASTRHWRGNGSIDNPYVISNRFFPQGSHVRIWNTDVHFLIVNNTFLDLNDAIDLRNAANGIVYNNSFTDSAAKAIVLTNCRNVKIIQNSIFGSTQNGIKVVGTNNLTIERNTIEYSGNNDQSAISLTRTSNSKIYENNLLNNPSKGISLIDCSNCTLAYNYITKNMRDSIYIQISQNCNIFSNYLADNEADAIFLDSNPDNIISNNIIADTKGSGISLKNSTRCSISGNRIDRCVTGIKIDNSHNGYIFDNEIEDNRGEGIYIYKSDNTVISSNIIIGNIDYGISFNDCGNGSFMWNDILNNIDLNNLTIQGYSNNIIGSPHHLSNNYWGNSTEPYLLDGNANTNDSNPLNNSVQLLSHLNLAPVSDNEILFGQVMLLEWDVGEGSNWNLSYSVFLSTDGGHLWNNSVSNTRNLTYTVDFADVPRSNQCVIKIIAWSANGVSKIGYSDQFSHYKSAGEILFHSPSNAQEIRESSTISWDYTGDFKVGEVYYDIYISKNNITWLLVEAQVFGETLNWNTIFFEDGEYFLKILAHTYYGLLQESVLNGMFEIDNHYLNPEPVLITPTEGEILRGNIFLSWTESVDSKGFPVYYNLYYSSIEGWQTIISNLTSSSYAWDTTTVKDGFNYRIKIEANSYYLYPSSCCYRFDFLSISSSETINCC